MSKRLPVRTLLSLLLLLTTWCLAAQKLPRDPNSQVVYRGQVSLPGLSQKQVLLRTIQYARVNLMPYASCFTYQAVDTTQALLSGISGTDYAHDATQLHYELWLRAQPGGYTYEVSNLRTLVEVGPAVPGADPLAVHHAVEIKVEAVLDWDDSYDKHHQPTPAMKAYCAAIIREVDTVLARLRTEMAMP